MHNIACNKALAENKRIIQIIIRKRGSVPLPPGDGRFCDKIFGSIAIRFREYGRKWCSVANSTARGRGATEMDRCYHILYKSNIIGFELQSFGE